MLDGKCIESIMKPPSEPPHEAPDDGNESSAHLVKGKGKAKSEFPDDHSLGHLHDGHADQDTSGHIESIKGGKRKQRVGDPHGHSVNVSGKRKRAPMGTPPMPSTSIRSRLRPRAGDRAGEISSTDIPVTLFPNVDSLINDPSAPSFNPDDDMRSQTRNSRRGRGRGGASRRGRGKGKGRGVPPPLIVEAEYEWVCPVPGCGQMHKSVRIMGEWRMDVKHGAIALYV